tara:strand:+ start:249 stop:491 length:243 start_codon:yes stop_codon:yes gene_type:complete
MSIDDRGSLDLTKQIDQLKENKEQLELKIKFLQGVCKSAGAKINELQVKLKEATSWKEEEVEKFKARLRDSAPYEKKLND